MGTLDVTTHRDEEQLRFFTSAVLRDVQALEQMLRDGVIESDKRRVGAEQEMFIIDEAMRPAPIAEQLLADLDDEHYTPELAKFNLEFNLDPFDFSGDCFAKVEAQANDLLARARAAARARGCDVVLTGILPTLKKEDMTLANMTPQPRYFALNEALSKLRGGDFRLRLKGIDDLVISHDSVMLEACNTSFQVHLQVTPDDFAMMYNISQALAGPVMACCSNSPMLFGKRLWRETRLALFQQSLDTRREEVHDREMQPRVSFGTGWVKESVLELYKEDIGRFRPLVGAESYEDPFEALKAGRAPELMALRLHTGTVYRWNRACYGVGGGKAHLRIENRLLPAGPSVLDEVANAALWLGAMHGFAQEFGDPAEQLDFDDAKNNLLAAARLGLDSQLKWVDDRSYPVGELVLEHLLPLARKGLKSCEVDAVDIDRLLNVIEERVRSESTGAAWQLRSFNRIRRKTNASEALHSIVACTVDAQERGHAVHEWKDAVPCDVAVRWSHQYERISSLMITDLYTVRAAELVDLAANMMDWWHLRHIPVEDDDHKLVGLVTHRTLMRYAFNRRQDDDRVAVKDIMETEVVSVTPDTRTLEALERMQAERISCLPVVDQENRLVGVVTEESLMAIASRLLEQKLKE